ncbi:Uncharacterised protein [Klebsiella michiganensis]|uniref:Uncharacterized protein n=1 Tax=Klebsiella michiganensis TaxID=1134687 RepID=A0A7H4N8V5_9ENTR|nr:Uncharacterised protein [Klebsiella michiganensis]
MWHFLPFIIVLPSLQQLKIWYTICHINPFFKFFIIINPGFFQLTFSKSRLWKNVVNMKMMGKVVPWEQQRKKREYSRVTIIHIQKGLHFLFFKPQAFSIFCHKHRYFWRREPFFVAIFNDTSKTGQ